MSARVETGPQTPVAVQQFYAKQRSYESRGSTVSSSVVPLANFGFGAGVLGRAMWAIISAHSNGVNLTLTGQNPTATFGIPIAAGGSLVIWGQTDIQRIALIRSGAADAQVTVTLGGFTRAGD